MQFNHHQVVAMNANKERQRLAYMGTNQQSALLFGGSLPPAPVVASPGQMDVQPSLEQAVQRVRNVYRPESSKSIYEGKTTEYFEYCDFAYPNDPYAKILDAGKMYKFMFYQTFREQKKRGGARGTGGTSGVRFDPGYTQK